MYVRAYIYGSGFFLKNIYIWIGDLLGIFIVRPYEHIIYGFGLFWKSWSMYGHMYAYMKTPAKKVNFRQNRGILRR